jgi:hypothetical protein
MEGENVGIGEAERKGRDGRLEATTVGGREVNGDHEGLVRVVCLEVVSWGATEKCCCGDRRWKRERITVRRWWG